ncbi:MAG TPA: DUF4349 domain-containing protein [Terriglobales bacterium]|nr:DUF4349 domain-containing protein [Terriglobales bacterium]
MESIPQAAVNPPVPHKRNYLVGALVGLALLAVLVAISVPNLLSARHSANSSFALGRMRTTQEMAAADLPSAGRAEFRKVIQTVSLDMRVEDPARTLDRIEELVASAGGYIEKSELLGWESSARSANVVLRVPAARLDAMRRSLRALGLRVESESVQSTDVTAQYVDLEASLRNFRAEEESYRTIMQRSGAIKDTLAVAQQLADVRGRIERTQAELALLSKRVEMATISVSLRPELPIMERAFRWHPLQVVKESFYDGLEGLAGYADTMIAILFRLPAILLWLGTWLLAGWVAWRLVRWAWRRFFGPAAPAPAAA